MTPYFSSTQAGEVISPVVKDLHSLQHETLKSSVFRSMVGDYPFPPCCSISLLMTLAERRSSLCSQQLFDDIIFLGTWSAIAAK